KPGIALAKLSEEDPTFRVHTDEEPYQTIISGMGELHLEILVDRMMRQFKVDANIGRPQVAYRETIRKRVEKVEGKFIRQSGGKGQYGHVVINMEPSGVGQGFVFEDKVVGGVIPREYIAPVEQGIKEALENGVLAEAALDVAGARRILDGVRALRRSAEVQGGRDCEQGQGVSEHLTNQDSYNGKGKVRAHQAPRERRNDRARRPRQDDADRGA